MAELASVHVDYGPDTAEEIELKCRIAEIQQRYVREVEPFVARLCEINARKVPRILIVPDGAAAELPASVVETFADRTAATCANWWDGRCETCGVANQGYEVAPTFLCPGYRARRRDAA